MKLIALILGLALEHAATQRLQLRELRWFDAYFDFAFSHAKRRGRAGAAAIVVLCLVIALVPVLWMSAFLKGTLIPWDLPYLLFAVFIVFLCLGPRDLNSEVDEYRAALDAGDQEAANRVLTELSEARPSGVRTAEAVEEAIFVQATNRIFGVAFWFVVFGPVGAWLFRIADLLRRRAAFESARDSQIEAAVAPAVESVHGILAWLPARLAALGYALSGSFDDAFDCWRRYEPPAGLSFHRSNERVVAAVGKAAMTGFLAEPVNSSAAARNSMRLVMRTLFIWITVIALMTIFGWAV
jgi:AmpE protein